MKIAILNSTDLPGGGASAIRLHKAFRNAGLDSKLGLLFQGDREEGVECLGNVNTYATIHRRFGSSLQSLLASILRPEGAFSDDVIAAQTARLLNFVSGTDIIQLGSIARFVNSNQIRRMAMQSGCPIVFTLNDHAPITGGCHYTNGCARFAVDCGSCPAIRSRSRFDLSAWTLRRKKRNLKGLNIGIVACSGYDEALVRKSPFFGKLQIARIP